MDKGKVIAIIIVIIFIGAIGYLFISSESAKTDVPSYIKGETREMYEWAKTEEGARLLEQVPCYCGCKFEGHKNTKNCFWTDDGNFDKHGITCSVCFDIAKKTKQMHEQGIDICTIRKDIDAFYAPNAHLGTITPMPENCPI